MISTISKPTSIDVGKLLFVDAIWGGAFIFIVFALDDSGPLSIAGWRAMVVIAILIGQLAVMVAGCSYATSSIVSRRLTHLPMISTSAPPC